MAKIRLTSTGGSSSGGKIRLFTDEQRKQFADAAARAAAPAPAPVATTPPPGTTPPRPPVVATAPLQTKKISLNPATLTTPTTPIVQQPRPAVETNTLPGQVSEFAKSTARVLPREVTSLYAGAAGTDQITPTSRTGKILLGNKPVTAPSKGVAAEYLKSKGVNPVLASIIQGALTTTDVAAQVIPFARSVVEIAKIPGIVRSTKDLIALNTLRDLTTTTAEKTGATATDTGVVTKVLNQGKEVLPQAIEATKPTEPAPLPKAIAAEPKTAATEPSPGSLSVHNAPEGTIAKAATKPQAVTTASEIEQQRNHLEDLKTQRTVAEQNMAGHDIAAIQRQIAANDRLKTGSDVTKIKGLDLVAQSLRDSTGKDLTLNDTVDYIRNLPTKADIATQEKHIASLLPKENVPDTVTTPKIVKVPAHQLPVGSGEEKLSRLEARIKGKLNAITPEDRVGLTTYSQSNNDVEIAKAANFAMNHEDQALAVLRGEQDAPEGMLHNGIGIAMHEKAAMEAAAGKTDLALKLTSIKSTRFGQEVQILRNMHPYDAVENMQKVRNVRIEAAGGEAKVVAATKKGVAEATAAVQKAAPKADELKSFIESIRC